MTTPHGTLFPSVADQHPVDYTTLDDNWPMYIQIQRIPAVINGNNISFQSFAYDPNTFLSSRAYIKMEVTMRKFEQDQIGNTVSSNFVAADRFYKKPGMVLHNSMNNVKLTLNSHTLKYNDLRYFTKKMNMAVAGKTINNRYLTTSGSLYEDFDGVYNEFGEVQVTKTPNTSFIGNTILDLGFVGGVGNETLEFVEATNTISITQNGGNPVDLFNTQIFQVGDIIELVSGETFRVQGVITDNDLLAIRTDAVGVDIPAQVLVAGDLLVRTEYRCHTYNADQGRSQAYDDARKDSNNGTPNMTLRFTEPLSFGCFNHLEQFDESEIHKKSWYLKMSKLIPYIERLKLDINFSKIAANTLIYTYGLSTNIGNDTNCLIEEVEIKSAELVLNWVRPRPEKIMSLPKTIKIQSWNFDHKKFDIRNNQTLGVDVILQESTGQVNENDQIHQIPSYILFFGMVDKDSDEYQCFAINTDSDNDGRDQSISNGVNSVEAGMRPFDAPEDTSLNGVVIRTNTLGGDSVIDHNYNLEELYRITLTNCHKDFPYSETRFAGFLSGENSNAGYPSQFFLLLGEKQLNSFFVRKGMLISDYLVNIQAEMTAIDGYSVDNSLIPTINGGGKIYGGHTFYVYDQFYIKLSDNGIVDSGYDAEFL